MDAKARMFVLAIPGARVVCDTLVNIGNCAFCRTHPLDPSVLERARAERTSDRCFIVGNGPSLVSSDLDALADEDCFAANHIYKMFDKTLWRPKFYVLQDRYSVLDLPLCDIPAPYIFASAYFLRKNPGEIEKRVNCYRTKRDLGSKAQYLSFSEDISDYVIEGLTVTYTMIQMAACIGYKDVYLLGMDHRYAVETNSKGVIVNRNAVRNHAFDDVCRETVANVKGMEKAYESARHYCDVTGKLRIFNATRGGCLEVFERVSLDAVLSKR